MHILCEIIVKFFFLILNQFFKSVYIGTSPSHMIIRIMYLCSALIDKAYYQGTAHLFLVACLVNNTVVLALLFTHKYHCPLQFL